MLRWRFLACIIARAGDFDAVFLDRLNLHIMLYAHIYIDNIHHLGQGAIKNNVNICPSYS